MDCAVLALSALLAFAAPESPQPIEIRGAVADVSGTAIGKAEILLTTAGLTVVATTRSAA
jgi:hypothetical protein